MQLKGSLLHHISSRRLHCPRAQAQRFVIIQSLKGLIPVVDQWNLKRLERYNVLGFWLAGRRNTNDYVDCISCLYLSRLLHRCSRMFSTATIDFLCYYLLIYNKFSLRFDVIFIPIHAGMYRKVQSLLDSKYAAPNDLMFLIHHGAINMPPLIFTFFQNVSL